MNASRSDPLAQLVMWNRLQAVVDEQARTLMRTAFSPIVRESGDLSAGAFDRDGRMLVQAVTGTPGHVNTMATAVAKFFDHFPRQSMRPGDIYLSNDPWIGSGHLNDFVLVKPCFRGDDLVGFVSCTSHLVDIGGDCMGPDGSDVFDEGLYIPPIRLLAEGRLDETLMLLLKANSRIPDESEGDVHALVACCEVGERRLVQMMNDFAIGALDRLSAHILEASQAATRARIAELPDGTYDNRMMTDGYDVEIELRAALTIRGDQITLDLAGCSGPSRYGINVPLNYATAYAVFGLKCAIAPDIPNNAGALAPFAVTAPAGVIVNAIKPAPVCSRHIVGQLLPDLALGCLHRAIPDRIPAEGAATLWDLPLRNGLVATVPNRPFSIELVHNGGTGARPLQDGLSATAYPSGVLGSLVEVTENVAPVLIRRRELRPDSGGAGRFRGGLGQVIELESCDGAPVQLFGTVDRVKHPARGREQGRAGATGILKLASGRVLNGKGMQEIPGGDRLLVHTPGGGGYGDPFSRDPDAVANDVADGLVSAATAERVYGVVLDAELRIDPAGTEIRRRADGLERPTVGGEPPRTTASAVSASRGVARIGVVVPVSNTNLEPDLDLLRPPGVSLHYMRAGGYDLDAVPDSDQMRTFALASLDAVIDALKATRPDVVLYGCTSATLSHGPAFDRSFCAEIERRAGVPAVTAAGAVVEALADLGVRRIGFCSPYVERLNEEAGEFLNRSGFEVVNLAYVGEALGNYAQGALSPAAVYALGLRADHDAAEAVVLSCTDMRAVEIISELEAAIGKPVVTSNQALIHAAMKRLRLEPGRAGGGRLLEA